MYLLDAVSPALPDSISGPHVVSILRQLVHHCFLRRGEFNKAKVHRGRLIPTCQLVTTKKSKRNMYLAFQKKKKSRLRNPSKALFTAPPTSNDSINHSGNHWSPRLEPFMSSNNSLGRKATRSLFPFLCQ